jgi:hypothetical protein
MLCIPSRSLTHSPSPHRTLDLHLHCFDTKRQLRVFFLVLAFSSFLPDEPKADDEHGNWYRHSPVDPELGRNCRYVVVVAIIVIAIAAVGV